MRKNLYLTSLLFAFMFLFVLMGVSAVSPDFNITSPTNNSFINGAVIFNITTAVDNFNNMTNCSIYVLSSSTNATTYNFLALLLNDSTFGSQPGEQVNGSVSTVGSVEDGTGYSINISCVNSSVDTLSKTLSNITFDNGEPQAPSGISPSTNTIISSETSQTFSSTVVDENTTSCTYVINRGGSSSDSKSSSGSGTYSVSSCTFTKDFNSSVDNGFYYITFTASDGSNTTTSSETILNVQIPGTNGGLPKGDYQTPEGRPFSVTGEGSFSDGWFMGIIQKITDWFKSLIGV